MNQILVIRMNVIVLLCNKQVIQNCEETEIFGKVKSIKFHQLLFIKAVLTDVLRVQMD
jgi:hypothetical protein